MNWFDVAIIIFIFFFVAIEVEGCHLCFLQKTLPRRLQRLQLLPVSPNQLQPSEYVIEYSGNPAVTYRSVGRRMTAIKSSENDNMPLVWKQSEENDENGTDDKEVLNSDNDDQGLKDLMVSWIKWYRNTLSPIMPPNCRFLPSCSNYAIDAIETYGAVKGGVLTAWRILRCNPFGGAGYDPPIWPPPGFFAGSNKQRW